MSTYTALIAAWNSVTQPPAGVTGVGLSSSMTTAQKLTAIDGWTVPTGVPLKAIFSPSVILNAIVPADLASLTATQVSFLTLVLQGSTVDGSAGTTVRAAIQNIFTGKTTTLSNLGALVAPFDNPTMPWWEATVAQGGGGLSSPVSNNDLVATGLT
jgi:hypothetical protein